MLDATLSAGVEEALAEGVTGSSNPFFGDANVDVLNSGTASRPGWLSPILEEAIGTTCRQGMIHATPAVVAALQAFPARRERSQRLATANGTPVVSGMGYQDVDTPWLAAPGDDGGLGVRNRPGERVPRAGGRRRPPSSRSSATNERHHVLRRAVRPGGLGHRTSGGRPGGLGNVGPKEDR